MPNLKSWIPSVLLLIGLRVAPPLVVTLAASVPAPAAAENSVERMIKKEVKRHARTLARLERELDIATQNQRMAQPCPASSFQPAASRLLRSSGLVVSTASSIPRLLFSRTSR